MDVRPENKQNNLSHFLTVLCSAFRVHPTAHTHIKLIHIKVLISVTSSKLADSKTVNQGTHTAQHAPHTTGPNLIKINTTNKQYTHNTTDTSSKLSFNNILKYFNHSFL
jgi:hypothetical protein